MRSLDQTYTYYSEKEVREGCRVSVEFGSKILVGFVESSEKTNETPEELHRRMGREIKPVLAVIDDQPLLTDELREIAEKMKEETLSPMIACYQCILPPKMKPVTSRHTSGLKERRVRLSQNEISLTPKQLEVYEYVRSNPDILYSQLRRKYPSLARKMITIGALEEYETERTAASNAHVVPKAQVSLMPAQTAAVEAIRQAEQDVVLLRGVTGSGKTEVYFHLAEEALSKRKQVLLLVPEIALTPQMINRVYERFGQELAVYHSGLSMQEKYEQYKKVKSGNASVVVGTRSAVFLPFDNLGLIVMDEEHDGSYKQDKQPSYHCRDIAVFRGQYHHCKVVLGSATPALESYARALKGIYALVEMEERVNQTVPAVTIVPMMNEMKNGSYILSRVLKEKIQDRLDKKEAVILLLNRRGFHSVLECRGCHEALVCPHCDLAMSYHRDIRRLKCHLCGYELDVPRVCPHCGSTEGFTTYGFGTEKLEQEIHDFFPQARTLRMDADTTSRKNGHEMILKEFSEGKADILLGTQMIAKGLDFPFVTLVGIIHGDKGLERSDFRSCETTFDLLMQAGGRSGRADKPGEVVYQVNNPDHYAVQCAAVQDYKTFFKTEMKFRHAAQYPPYTYMISLLIKNRSEQKVNVAAMWIKQNLCGTYQVLGITELVKLKDQYRARIVLKGKDLKEMRKDIRTLIKMDKKNYMNFVQIDVNPMVLE